MKRTATQYLNAVCILAVILSAGCSTQTSSTDSHQPQGADRIGILGYQLAQQISEPSRNSALIKRIIILPIKISDEAHSGWMDQLDQSRSSVARMLQDTLPDVVRTEVFRLGKYDIVADKDMRRAIQQLNIESKLYTEGRYLDEDEMNQLGAMLSAQAILDGNISRSEERLRVALELIEIETGKVVAVGQGVYP